MTKVNKNPKGLHTVTPGLTVNDAKGAIEFYKKHSALLKAKSAWARMASK